jgi:hypothetical protein
VSEAVFSILNGIEQKLSRIFSGYRSPLEMAITETVREQFDHKPPEPGDTVILNDIIEQMCRRYRD